MYCSRVLVEGALAVSEGAHVQSAVIMAVCDACGKPSEAKYSQHDFTKYEIPAKYQENITLNRCSACGGNLNNGKCSACTAEQYTEIPHD
jgi:hypothetical protein